MILAKERKNIRYIMEFDAERREKKPGLFKREYIPSRKVPDYLSSISMAINVIVI